MSLFEKSNLDSVEYVFKRALVHMGMRRVPQEKVDKILKGPVEGENE
jgi:hypothetical protein